MKIYPEEFQHDRISDYLYRHAARIPGREAAWDERGSSLSYAGLLAKVEACANGLISLGIKKGDRVAALSPPHSDYLVVFLATTALGAIWVGLNPRYTRAELEQVMADAEPVIVFARTRVDKRAYGEDLQCFQDTMKSLRHVIILGSEVVHPGVISYQQFISENAAVNAQRLKQRRDEVRSTDAALLIYTSGTTGKPKGAILSHYGAIRQAYVQRSLRRDNEVRQINAYPINHLAGAIASSTYCLVVGGTSCFLEKFAPEAVLKTIEEKRITVWGGVPVMLQTVLDHPDFSSTDFSSVTEVAYSGGSTAKVLLQRIADEVCPRITTMYALTEAAGTVTAIPSTRDVDLLAASVGKPISDCEFRLANATGQPVDKGEEGEIQVRGPFVMQGYWRSPGTTRQAIDEQGWLHTGDVAVERPDGNIVLVGRLSDMYKSGGYNIHPREIEQVLETHPAVNFTCVLGVPDPVYDEVGLAFVTLTPGQTASETALREHCYRRLANYKVPKYVLVESELPLLPNNKPDKRKLRGLARNVVQKIQGTPE